MKKIALVTGAALRIGKEIALHLSRNGWKVIIHFNSSTKEAKELAKKISQISESLVIQQDLNNIKQINSFFNNIKKQTGTPTLLVNNAAMFVRDDIDVTAESLTSHMNVNCFAPILLSQEFAKTSSEEKIIINIIDSFANTPTKNYTAYNISKTAMLYATKCLALKFPDCRINTISPGMVIEPEEDTEKEIFRKLVKTTHKHKRTHIDDILKSIDSILDEGTMNGQNIDLTNKEKVSFRLTF
jgi:NAD(P)-dependent dehydrogenase (short-subunit alcohol dehydrogenase family)